jgi:hypothetical protein
MIHVLQAMGAVVGLSDTILGLTVLAFANSVHRPPLQPFALLSRTLPAADLKE